MKHYLRFMLVLLLSTVWCVGGYSQETVYSTGFEEDEGFTTATNYQGNKTLGPTEKQWFVYYGCVSTSSKISGSASLQMRYYASEQKTPYAQMNFSVENVTDIKFNAAAGDNGDIKVEYSVDDGKSWIGAKQFSIKTTVTAISYNISKTALEKVRIKITWLKTVKNKNVNLRIDDFQLINSDVTIKKSTTTTFGADIDGKIFKVYKGGSFPTYKATATDESGKTVEGTYKYTSSNTACVTVDETTGQTTAGTEFGKADIKVDFTPTDAAYEGSSASYTIDYKDVIPMLTFSESSVTVTKGLETEFKEPTVTLNDGLGNNVDLTGQTIIYGAEPEGIVDVEIYTGKITWIKPGTTTIKAIVYGGEYDNASGEYTIDYKKADTAIEFVEGETSVNINNSIAVKAVLKANGVELSDVKPKYTSSSNEIATVDENGNVTGVAVGKVTITASFASNDYYNGATSATYDVSVIDPNIVFYESFDKCDGTGGNDDKWSNSIASGDYNTSKFDMEGWARTGNVYVANKCIRLGSGSGSGSVTTKKISYTGDAVLTFKAGAWKGKKTSGAVVVTITNGNLSYNGKEATSQTIDIPNAAFGEFTMNIVGASEGMTLKFATVTYEGNQFFLDEVKVTATKSEQAESVTLTEGNNDDVIIAAASAGKPCNVTLERTMIADGGWYTFCVPFDIEDIATTPLKDAQVRKYSSMSGSVMNFEETKSLKAAHAYLVRPTANIENPVFENVTVSLGDSEKDGADGYFFEGIYSEKELSTDGTNLFLGADNKFYIPTGTDKIMKALRGYFVAPSKESGSKMGINIDGETNYITTLNGSAVVYGKVYNLNGQYVGNDVKSLKKGVYVVNGRKFIVK